MKQAVSKRRKRLIQEVLDQRRMNFRGVARELGITPNTVNNTASGKSNNRLVLQYFLDLGIDPDVLDLPVRAGTKRRFRLIQEALDQAQTSFSDVAKRASVSTTSVTKTARGACNSKRVLRVFLELGVDPDILDLPEDLRAEVNNTRGVAR